MAEEVTIPKELFEKFQQAALVFHDLEDSLEAFLIAHDSVFKEHLASQTRSLDDVMGDLD